MHEKIEAIIQKAVEEAGALSAGPAAAGVPTNIAITVPDRREFGHYSTHVALQLAKIEKKNPIALAQEIAACVMNMDAKGKTPIIEKVEVV